MWNYKPSRSLTQPEETLQELWTRIMSSKMLHWQNDGEFNLLQSGSHSLSFGNTWRSATVSGGFSFLAISCFFASLLLQPGIYVQSAKFWHFVVFKYFPSLVESDYSHAWLMACPHVLVLVSVANISPSRSKIKNGNSSEAGIEMSWAGSTSRGKAAWDCSWLFFSGNANLLTGTVQHQYLSFSM